MRAWGSAQRFLARHGLTLAFLAFLAGSAATGSEWRTLTSVVGGALVVALLIEDELSTRRMVRETARREGRAAALRLEARLRIWSKRQFERIYAEIAWLEGAEAAAALREEIDRDRARREAKPWVLVAAFAALVTFVVVLALLVNPRL